LENSILVLKSQSYCDTDWSSVWG